MRLYSALLLATGLACGLHAEDDLTRHRQAAAAIRALGGTVEEGAQPGTPVAARLTGSPNPRDCLPHLKHLVNLRTLDL